MRHCRSIVAVLLSAASGVASACSCVKWDPAYVVSEYAAVFLGEVTASDRAHPEQVTWHSGPISAVPITVRVVESLKGDIAGDQRLLQVGPPSSCAIDLHPGERRVFLIWKPTPNIVGYCNVVAAAPQVVDALKSAAKGKQ